MKPLLEIKQTAFTSNWKVLKIKRVLDIPITDGPHETPELLDKGIPFLSAESVKKGKLDFNLKRGYISKEDHEKYINKCKPQRDDIFMIKSGATTGNVAIVETDEEFSIWSPLALIRADKEKITSKYLYYFIGSLAFRQQVEISWSFGTQQNIGMKVIENLFISVPPLFLQEKLVKYIEGEVIKIDKLIDMKELEIKLLEQQRQSIITEAVTKGLNPNVKMKDSGVEWIGEIPEHWDITKIKYSVDLMGVKAEEDSDLQYIGLENIEAKTGKYLSTENVEIDGAAIRFYKDNVLFGKLRPYLTKALLAEFDGRCSTEILVMKVEEEIILNQYLRNILLSPNFIDEVNSSTYGSKMPRANWSFIGNVFIPLPAVNEQKEIIEEILKVEERHFILTHKLEKQIEKLKEYRQSLIYEAVTGKIDVRDLELD